MMKATRALLPLLLALVACQDEPSAVRLVIGSDLDVPDEIDEIEVTLTASRTSGGNFCEPATRSFSLASGADLPVPVVVEAGGDYNSWLLYRATGLLGGVERLRVEGTTLWFGPGTFDVAVALERRCLELVCEPGEVCVDGTYEASSYATILDGHDRIDEEEPCDPASGGAE